MTRMHYPVGALGTARVCGACREPWRCPGAEQALDPALVTTAAAKETLERPVFPAIGSKPRPLGGHVAVNGHDLERIEREAFELGRDSVLARSAPETTER
jgi:hypothetical protein